MLFAHLIGLFKSHCSWLVIITSRHGMKTTGLGDSAITHKKGLDNKIREALSEFAFRKDEVKSIRARRANIASSSSCPKATSPSASSFTGRDTRSSRTLCLLIRSVYFNLWMSGALARSRRHTGGKSRREKHAGWYVYVRVTFSTRIAFFSAFLAAS